MVTAEEAFLVEQLAAAKVSAGMNYGGRDIAADITSVVNAKGEALMKTAKTPLEVRRAQKMVSASVSVSHANRVLRDADKALG